MQSKVGTESNATLILSYGHHCNNLRFTQYVKHTREKIMPTVSCIAHKFLSWHTSPCSQSPDTHALLLNAYATRVEAVAASYLNVGGICCLVYASIRKSVEGGEEGYLSAPCSNAQDGEYMT